MCVRLYMHVRVCVLVMKRVLRSAIKQWAGAMPFIAPLPVEAAEEESVEDKNVGVEEPSAQDEGKNLYVVVVCALSFECAQIRYARLSGLLCTKNYSSCAYVTVCVEGNIRALFAGVPTHSFSHTMI